MKTTLFFYTGTGNSLWTTKILAEELNNTEIIFLSKVTDRIVTDSDCIGLVFPVHIWGLPNEVIKFVDKLLADNTKYYFAIAVNAGQVAATLLQLEKLFKIKGITLSTGFSIVLPSNYIPWGGAMPEEKQQERFINAKKKIKQIADIIKNKEKLPMEKGSLWQNVLFSYIYKLSFKHIPQMDNKFWVDEKCNGCKICEKVCNVHNIKLKDGKPVWQHKCEQCLACIQWCPKEAIQYGKKTTKYKRYHHPEIKLQEIIECVPEK